MVVYNYYHVSGVLASVRQSNKRGEERAISGSSVALTAPLEQGESRWEFWLVSCTTFEARTGAV